MPKTNESARGPDDGRAGGAAPSGGRKVRVAVVGVGHLGSAHARTYRSLGDAGHGIELVAVADVDEGKAARVGEEMGARPFADYRDIPEDAEAVSVVVPSGLHREVAEFFLARGSSVLVEKPMAPSAAEAERLAESASKASGILQVGHIERFNPAVRAARSHLDRPRFMECRRVAPFSFRSKDIGVVFDLMIHDLDIVRWFFGGEPARVEAVGTPVLRCQRAGIQESGPLDERAVGARRFHEDIANARLVFENGCVADITASRVAAKAERALRIFQESSYMSVDTMKPGARLLRRSAKLKRGEIDVSKIGPADVDDPHEFLFKELLELEQLPLPPESPLEAELESFVDSVRTGSPPAVTAHDGLEAIRLAEKVLAEVRG